MFGRNATGTFTDVVLRGDDGGLTIEKTLTTPDDLLGGFFRGVSSALAKRGITAEAVDGLVVHATTVVTNALIERKGAPTALVVTNGFRDVLTIRNEHRYDMFDPQIEFSAPLVAPEMTFGIVERTLSDGVVETAPSDAGVAALAEQIAASGARAIALCLLNSFANPANERAIAVGLKTRLPDLFLCASSNVSPQIRRISAHLDHRDQCVCDADLAALSAPHDRAAGRKPSPPTAHRTFASSGSSGASERQGSTGPMTLK